MYKCLFAFLIKNVNAVELTNGIIKTINLLKQGQADKIIERAMNDAKKYTIENTINNITFKLNEISSK